MYNIKLHLQSRATKYPSAENDLKLIMDFIRKNFPDGRMSVDFADIKKIGE